MDVGERLLGFLLVSNVKGEILENKVVHTRSIVFELPVMSIQ